MREAGMLAPPRTRSGSRHAPRDAAPWLCWLALTAWCAVLFFYGMSAAELWRTENLRAIVAEGMLRTGNWVVPTLYGEPFFTKPPGMYVAIALCSLPFGEVTEFTARLPSALAATLTVVLFYLLFSRYLGRAAGLIAGLVLPMSVMYLDKAPAAEIDMLQVAWVVAALLCFLRVLELVEDGPAIEFPKCPRQNPGWTGLKNLPSTICNLQSRQLYWWLAALLCVAGGVLTKWTAPAFFYATVVAMLWWRGRLRLLFGWQHVVSAVLAGCLCVGWAAAAAAQTGWEIFVNTVLGEGLPRLYVAFSNPQHQRLNYGWGAVVYPWWMLATTLPWSVIALWSLKPGFAALWDDRARRLLVFLHCWTWPNLIFWTLMADHTPRYAFPLCPGIAGLAVLVFWAWWTGKLPVPRLWPLPGIPPRRFLLGMLAVWLGIKAAFVEYVMPARNGQREPRAKGRLLASLVPPGATLFLFGLKDEGIMFYFGGDAVRLESLDQLPSHAQPVYCILNQSEWEQWRNQRPMRLVQHLVDEQGDPIVLVQVLS